MPEPRPLSVAFVEAHPVEAAQVLEGLPAPESAAYLASLAARVAATLVKNMAPKYAARCAEALPAAELVAVVEALGPQPAAALLQHLERDRQAKVLESLPVGTAVAVRLLIGYPYDTAGSCMDPWALALPAEMGAADALEELKRFDGDAGDVVFVVGAERRLLGVVSVGVLLRSPPREVLSRIMRQPAPSVSALTPLAATRGHPAWTEMSALAVVERQGRLVGALRRPVLEAALSRQHALLETAGSDSLAGLGGAYWQTLATLAQLAVSMLPPVKPIENSEEDHER